MSIYNNIGILFKCVLLDANGWWWDYREGNYIVQILLVIAKR